MQPTFEETTRQNTAILGLSTASWVLTMALATFGPEFIWESATLSVLGILLNLICGVFMIWANVRFILALDELQKLIQLTAMSFALGVAVVVGLAYSLLDVTQVVYFDAEISHLVILIGITYGVVFTIGQVKYR